MGWLRVLKTIVEIVVPVLGWLGKKKAQKKAARIEKVAETVIKGVEAYSKTEGTTTDKIKAVIKSEAVNAKVDAYLKELVLKYTTPKPK